VSSNWVSSQNVAGYYNTGYWAAPTAPISDGANFWFYLDDDTCYDVDAWWTSAFDRSPSAPFIAYDGSDTEVGRINVNQAANGSRWNDLGDWVFTPGWNRVMLSRWTGTGAYVIADALRLTPDDDCPGWCGGDTDGDGTDDCTDQCPADPGKIAPGQCGCGTADTDGDGDGTADCLDTCPADPNKTAPGTCGCGIPDIDLTGDGVPDCAVCGDGVVTVPETCDDSGLDTGDGCSDTCQVEPLQFDPITPATAGVVNTFTARNAVPGSEIWFLAGRAQGTTPVPGCPGLVAPVGNPAPIAPVFANAAGTAQLNLAVPAAFVGRTVPLLAVDLDGCRVSNLQIESF
jgi:cysteine-rich repeat protein